MVDKLKDIGDQIRLRNQGLNEIFTNRAPEGIEDLDEIVIRDILGEFNDELGELEIDFREAANYYDNTNIQVIEILEKNRVNEDKTILDYKAFMRILLDWL